MFLFQVERLRKIEMASDMDEILKEEIREYKETLTCPSCKVKRKDAVLTKCFHCFCYDCLRTRFVDLLAEMAEPVPRTGSKVPYLEPVTKLEPWFHIFGTMVPQH